MNNRKFLQWLGVYSGVKDPESIEKFKAVFENCPDIDRILQAAINEKLDLAGIDPLIQAAYQANSEPDEISFHRQRPVRPVQRPERPSLLNKFKDKLRKRQKPMATAPEVPLDEGGDPVSGHGTFIPDSVQGTMVDDDDEPDDRRAKPKSKKRLYIGIGVLILIVGAILIFSSLGHGSSSPDLRFDAMSTATIGTGSTSIGNRPWFMQSAQDGTAFLTKPKNLTDFFTNVEKYWFWLIWMLFIVPQLALLKEDRFAAGEKTDLVTVTIGLIVLFVTILLAEPIALMIGWFVSQVGVTATIESGTIVAIGIFANLFLQLGATTSGKRDYSALAIAGLFTTGTVMVWWWTSNLFMTVLGVVLMASGLVLQAYEMNRTHQGNKAVVVALIMLVLFGLSMGAWYLLTGATIYVPPAQGALGTFYGLVLRALYSSRLWVGAIVGMGITYAFGSQIASALMGIVNPKSRESDDYPDQADRSTRMNLTARFDAMVFGIMLLYPISFAIFEVMKLF